MMDENDEQQIPAVQNRNEAFGQGLTGGQVMPPPSLQEDAARYNSETPTVYRPSGSGNGMSAGQAEATLGGALGVGNGSAEDTWSTKRYFTSPE